MGAFLGFKKRDKVIVIQTEKVGRRDITELVVANGRIQPVIQVVIQPEVSGEIIDLPVKEGQPVKKGDLLVKIKPDNYIASRNSALASYKSGLARTKPGQSESRQSGTGICPLRSIAQKQSCFRFPVPGGKNFIRSGKGQL